LGGIRYRSSQRFAADIAAGELDSLMKRWGTEELAFYGDIDFIPTEAYTLEDAKEAIEGANVVVKIAKK
jgi:hypothetical protein